MIIPADTSFLHWCFFPSDPEPLDKYVKLRVALTPRMPRTFFPPPRVSDPDIHHGTCVRHVPWCMAGSLISDFLWSRWRGKCSWHSWRMRNPKFYESGKRPILTFPHTAGWDWLSCTQQGINICSNMDTTVYHRPATYYVAIVSWWNKALLPRWWQYKITHGLSWLIFLIVSDMIYQWFAQALIGTLYCRLSAARF